MWTPSPEIIITAAQKAAEAAAAARKARYPDLEARQFWSAMRFFGYEDALRAYADGLKPADMESETYVADLAYWSDFSSLLERGQFFVRDDPRIEGARIAFGLTGEQLDSMWAWAAQPPLTPETFDALFMRDMP